MQKQEIYRLLTTRQFQQAEQSAITYLTAAPRDCNVRVMLGIALREQSKVEPAFKAFQTAATHCPQSVAAVEGAAETAFQLHEPQAKNLVLQAIKLRPTDQTGYAMLGAIDALTGDCSGAVENYAKAPNLVRGNIPALRQYGECLISLDQPAAAVPLFTQLLALADTSENRTALAYAQDAAKDRPAALSTLQPLLGMDSRDSSAFLLAAQIAEADNDTPKAVEWFRKALELNPQNITAYLDFSVVCFNHGAFKVGVDFMTLGIKQLPKEARLYLARGVLEEQMTQMDAALSDFEEAHRLDPQLSFAEDAMGMLFSQKHDPAAAIAIFARQSQLHPDDALLQYLYAEALSEAANGDEKLNDKALITARRAVKLEPAYLPAHDLLCVLLMRSKDFEGVVAQAHEALKIDPYDEAAIYQELLAEHKLKHADKAALLVKQLENAKAHNQQGHTKYALQEAPPATPAH
ncbi:tetratricopeptide repeat protein [Edaphobacter sp. DSM 109919]|uniref:Tetratricopeptide repeat protein n=1 Tax=Edaphobacter paludis TaxID=3035702 RepID=A0AAU7CUD1_9BACT